MSELLALQTAFQQKLLESQEHEPCTFLSLPLEVRQMIYNLIGSELEDFYHRYLKDLAHLLRTSKQVYKDVIPYLYRDRYVVLSTCGTAPHVQPDDRDSFALSHIQRLVLKICRPYHARESLAAVCTYLRKCPAMTDFRIHVDSTDDGQYRDLVIAILGVRRLTPYPVDFQIIAKTWGLGRTNYLLPNADGAENRISDSEIRAQLPSPEANDAVIRKFHLVLSLQAQELKSLAELRVANWHMIKTYEHWGLVAGEIGLSWEKVSSDGASDVDDSARQRDMLRPRAQNNWLSQSAAESYYN
ncbi:MAG: hypothetical protein Q9160_005766 [Pyrenula sp. 1 TL-2023]